MAFKKIFSVVIISIFSLVSVGCSQSKPIEQVESKPFKFSTDISKVNYKKIEENFYNTVPKVNLKMGTSFAVLAFPGDKNAALLASLSEGQARAYTDEQIKTLYEEKVTSLNGYIQVPVAIHHLGSFDDYNQIILDDKFYEFFRLENDKHEVVKAVKQDPININYSQVSMSNEQSTVNLYFPEKEIEKIMENSKTLTLVFPGVDLLPEGQRFIQFEYPFSKYYEKDVPELPQMLTEINQ